MDRPAASAEVLAATAPAETDPQTAADALAETAALAEPTLADTA
jgi:hypothetical protein